MEYLVSSTIGTVCAEILTLPICTVKTIYQNTTNTNISNIVKQIYNTQGINGFFQASTPAIMSQVISTSSKYYFYHTFKNLRKTNDNNILANSINGALGGVCGSLFSHPFDVWKNYLQRKQKPHFKINILYAGYSASIIKNIVLYSLLFPLYDFYKLHMPNSILASIATTLTCSLVTQPVDYYKTVLMSGAKFTSWRNPYKGFSLMVSRSIPHFIISMNITDYIKKNINSKKNSNINKFHT